MLIKSVVMPFKRVCLDVAMIQTSGDWTTPNNKNLSHITFYDTSEIPLPAAVWLFGSALAGVAFVRRRRNA